MAAASFGRSRTAPSLVILLTVLILLLLCSSSAFASTQVTTSTQLSSTTSKSILTTNASSLSTSESFFTNSTTVSSTNSSASINSSLLPVIVIPGVGGSFLTVNGQPAWPFPANASVIQGIGLKADGVTPLISGSKVSVTGIMRSGFVNYYGALIQNLTGMGYVENKTLFVFPYDWRMDLSTLLPLLDNAVNAALKASNSSKVILIAHSMGGLIATSYVVSAAARASKVDSIITLGTPFWGAPLAYYAAVSGYTFGNPFVDRLQMKSLSQNMTSLYELLPHQPFINTSDSSLLSLATSYGIRYKGIVGNASSPALKKFNSTASNIWSLNQGLLNSSMKFWSILGSKNSPSAVPVKLYTIIGYGFQTLSGYNLRPAPANQSYLELSNGTRVILTPIFSDGDGTVPIASAQISTAKSAYYIANIPGNFLGRGKVSAAHGDLPSNPTALKIIDGIVAGKPPSSTFYAAPRSLQKSTIDFTLHSNAVLSINDSTGRLGPNSFGTIDETLSSGTFLDIDGVEYASLQNLDDSYTVLVKGTSSGEFSLYVNVTQGGLNTLAISYPDIRVQNGSIAELQLSLQNGTVSALPYLKLQNGSGVSVSKVSPVVIVDDQIAASSQASDQLFLPEIVASSAIVFGLLGVGAILLARKKRTD